MGSLCQGLVSPVKDGFRPQFTSDFLGRDKVHWAGRELTCEGPSG